MAPLFNYFTSFIFFSSFFFFASSQIQSQLSQLPTNQILSGRRILLEKDIEDELSLVIPKIKKSPKPSNTDDDEQQELPKKKKKLTSLDDDQEFTIPNKKKSTIVDDEVTKIKKSSNENDTKIIKSNTTPPKNQTKLTKPTSSVKNQTKLVISSSTSSKNKTKLIKPIVSNDVIITKTNSTKKTSLDLSKPKTKSDPKKQTVTEKPVTKKNKPPPSPPPPSPTSWLYNQDEDDDDLISEFRDLPTKFQQTFVPDLQKISTTSKIYLTKANKEMSKSFKPYVGTKYATSAATVMSFAFIIVPLLLVSLIFNRIKAYFSLQRLIIFIQIYLAIYFSILCVSSLVTGLEPLRFFYATSRSTYVWLQLLQTLGYALYLLLLLMYLVLVFSTESGLGHKLLGLAQTLIGFAVGLHYYMTVFHRVVLRQPPKTNWKVHGIYATCFVVICLLAQAERRKKAYLEEGGQQGKQN